MPITTRTQRFTLKELFHGFAVTGATSVYSVPTTVATKITRIKATNMSPTSASATIKMWVGASATDQYIEMDATTLARSEAIEFSDEMALDALKKFWLQASVDGAIVVSVNGEEWTP